MNYRKFNWQKILLILCLFIDINLYSEEPLRPSLIVKSGGHHVSSQPRIRVNIAPVYTDYEDDYPGCILYYYHYGYPPSAFNFGLRKRRGKDYYYCPRGYYYKRSRYRNSHHRHTERKQGRHRH